MSDLIVSDTQRLALEFLGAWMFNVVVLTVLVELVRRVRNRSNGRGRE